MDSIGHYLARFKELDGARAQAPGFLTVARRAAIARFTELGFPGPKDEDWRATPLEPIAQTAFEPSPSNPVRAVDLAALLPPSLLDLGGPRLVFVNGVLAPALSTRSALDGVEIASLETLLSEAPGRLEPYLATASLKPLHALNSAFFRDGALVVVREGARGEAPIHLVHVATSQGKATLAAPRNLILLGEGASARIVESYVGGDALTYTDAVTEIRLGSGASLDHYRLQRESDRAFHTGMTHVAQGRDSKYRSYSIADGGALSRHELEVVLGGRGASCSLDGLSVLGGRQLADHHTFVDHAQPDCTSAELYKGVLAGGSRLVFHGRVLVRPDAQKTDARQATRNLLLSPEAQVNAKPQLEIHADDVKCTHGAAVGQLDNEALFYLRSRGLGVAEARAMLVEAFAGGVLQRMELMPVREAIAQGVRERILLASRSAGPREVLS